MIRLETGLWLLTPEELKQLPNGTNLTSISGATACKGKSVININLDTRAGHTAWGIFDPLNHPEHELFLKFQLQG